MTNSRGQVLFESVLIGCYFCVYSRSSLTCNWSMFYECVSTIVTVLITWIAWKLQLVILLVHKNILMY